MTTTLAWISYQNEKPVALSFASDSRLSWPGTPGVWDSGRKIFWARNSPDIFGFAGDVVTQSNVVSQVCDIFDCSVSMLADLSGAERHGIFVKLLESAVNELKGVSVTGINVLHGMRDCEGKDSKFRLWRTGRDIKSDCWFDQELQFEIYGQKNTLDEPGPFFCAGSGASKYRDRWLIRRQEAGDTSRSFFRALVDVIQGNDDPQTGGCAQVASLGLSGQAKPVGIRVGGQSWIAGLRLGAEPLGQELEWRDEDFRFLNATTLKPKKNAAHHTFRK